VASSAVSTILHLLAWEIRQQRGFRIDSSQSKFRSCCWRHLPTNQKPSKTGYSQFDPLSSSLGRCDVHSCPP